MAHVLASSFRIDSLAARCGVVTLSGVAYAMAFPPLGWRWLIVPGVAGLLWSLKGERGSRARGLGFLHGMVVYGLGLPWLWVIFGAFAPLLWAILAAFTAAFAGMQSRAEVRGITGRWFVLFTVINWCGWEFIRAELFPLKFPWMTLGLAIGPSRLLPWIGVYSSGLFIVLVAASLMQRRWVLAVIGTLVVMSGLGGLKWAGPSRLDPKTIQVAGLQYEDASLNRFIEGTRALPPHIQFVVWPEYAVPFDVRAHPRDWAALQELCRTKNLTLTLGTQTRLKDLDGWYNTALTLDTTGALGEHYKAHPVHFFDDGTAGVEAAPVATSLGKIGTPICFDCDYEGVVRRMTAAGAEAFIVPMMDEESWGMWQHQQHAELFRIRACENERWFFVCGTSGVSQVIALDGDLVGKLAAMEQGVLQGAIRRESRLTFYTRWGWLTPWCLLIIATLCWIVLLLPRRAAKDIPS